MPTLIASAKAKIVYLNIPKSGCTSFKNWLYWLDYGTYLEDPMSVHRLQESLFLIYDDKPEAFQSRLPDYTFTFVRHPLRRSYATFNDKIAHSDAPYFKRMRRVFSERYNVRLNPGKGLFGFLGDAKERERKWHRDGFLKFLHFVEDTKVGRIDVDYDWHWAEQTYVLENARPIRSPDFIGKLENMAEDFPAVAAQAGVPAESLRHLNEGARLGPSYDEIVDDEVRELGATVYANDFRELGYKP